jgi:hypothetical protein
MNNNKAYRVHIVVDPNYGEKIFNLPFGEPSWIVESAENYKAIQEFCKRHPELNELNGITAFKFNPTAKPESWLIDELSAIDLHHGEYSHTPHIPFWTLLVLSGRSQFQRH